MPATNGRAHTSKARLSQEEEGKRPKECLGVKGDPKGLTWWSCKSTGSSLVCSKPHTLELKPEAPTRPVLVVHPNPLAQIRCYL